jgi:hypothetical protein
MYSVPWTASIHFPDSYPIYVFNLSFNFSVCCYSRVSISVISALSAESVFVYVYGAKESIPRNRLRQADNRFLCSLKGLQIRAMESLYAMHNFSDVCYHRVNIFTRDETGSVYLPTQLERTLQLYW